MSSQPKVYTWRGAIFRALIITSGLCAAFLTIYARRQGDWQLARAGAIASLVIVVLMVVFVVPPLARSARLEAARLDLPFQLTGGGLIFIGLFLIVAFAAWNTGNNLLFLIFSVLVSTFFVAWSAARASLRDLVVSARFPDHIFAGERAPVLVTLHNTKRLLPSFSVLVEARSRVEREGASFWQRWSRPRFRKHPLAYFMYAPHGARVEQRVEQVFQERGHVLITGFEISTRFPFGFFRLRRRLRARHVDLIIYPRPEPASDELHLLPMNAGRLASARRGAGHDLYSLRDYQPQDDMRHIDWKATARSNRLIVREFTSEDERRVHVVLDTRLRPREDAEQSVNAAKLSARGEGEKSARRKRARRREAGQGAEKETSAEARGRFERGVVLAASLVKHFTEEKAEVRLTLNEDEGQYGAGREHLYDSLRRLALVVPSDQPLSEKGQADFWQRIAPATRDDYVILLTTAPPGSIPSNVWRKSHVIYL